MPPPSGYCVPTAGATVFGGAEAAGAALILLFFATIGAGAGAIGAMVSNLYTIVFIVVQLAVREQTHKRMEKTKSVAGEPTPT